VKAELAGLRARQLKQRLDELKVDTSSCFDRDSLEKKLVDALMFPPAGGYAAPSSCAVPSPFRGVRLRVASKGKSVAVRSLTEGRLGFAHRRRRSSRWARRA
jgi:hypothetical protein